MYIYIYTHTINSADLGICVKYYNWYQHYCYLFIIVGWQEIESIKSTIACLLKYTKRSLLSITILYYYLRNFQSKS